MALSSHGKGHLYYNISEHMTVNSDVALIFTLQKYIWIFIQGLITC
jgi:hypothetical protein